VVNELIFIGVIMGLRGSRPLGLGLEKNPVCYDFIWFS